MYELIRKIDFSKKANNPDKRVLKKKFIEWLNLNFPNVNTENTYFSDSIFIGNNPSLGLNIIDVLMDDDGYTKYHSKLIEHFEAKGYDSKIADEKAREYLDRFHKLKCFLDEYEKEKFK